MVLVLIAPGEPFIMYGCGGAWPMPGFFSGSYFGVLHFVAFPFIRVLLVWGPC